MLAFASTKNAPRKGPLGFDRVDDAAALEAFGGAGSGLVAFSRGSEGPGVIGVGAARAEPEESGERPRQFLESSWRVPGEPEESGERPRQFLRSDPPASEPSEPPSAPPSRSEDEATREARV
jgi:hypothetical protein